MSSGIIRYVGIDFGTSYSKIAYYKPKTDEAEVISNVTGGEHIPSLVYYGKDHTGADKIEVGEAAQEKLEDATEWECVIASIKRDLLVPEITLPHRTAYPVDVVTEILRKLKKDAEKDCFHGEEIRYVTLTYPATFSSEECNKLREAAYAAGFKEVKLLKEPVAAAIAYGREGMNVGQNILVYDLGGGTFDLAVLARQADGTFEPPIDALGIHSCGGDDFDHELYNYCDSEARRQFNRPVTQDGKLDQRLLKQCCDLKENLTRRQRVPFRYWLEPDGTPLRLEIRREQFETFIRKRVEETVERTKAILQQARNEGCEVDTFVLIGGSSRVPLVERLLREELPPQVQLRPWAKGNVAVVLGAAYYAYEWWKPEAQYRRSVEQVAEAELDDATVARLKNQTTELDLREEQAAKIEREVLGATKEAFSEQQQQAVKQYRKAVEQVRSDLTEVEQVQSDLIEKEVENITALAQQLRLNGDDVLTVEPRVSGEAKETISSKADVQADVAIGTMVATVVGTALVPAYVNWALTATAMGTGVIAIGLCYDVKLTKDEAWKLVKQFIFAAGSWFLAMNIGAKILAALIESTGLGYGVAVALDAAVSAATAYAIGKTAKAYFKGERNQKELGKLFRESFTRKKAEVDRTPLTGG